LRVRFPHLQHFNELIFAFAPANASRIEADTCTQHIKNTGIVTEASMNPL
jgi:hypothetical protein